MEETATVSPGEAPRDFDVLLDIPVELTVEIGRTRLAIRELLQLGPGSVVELGKPAGEELDILVNGTPVARGEAVVVDDRFGVRVTSVLRPGGPPTVVS